MAIQLSQEIEYKNPVLWFADMYFDNATAALNSPVKQKVRIFYLENLPDGATYTTHWHTYTLDVDGSIIGVEPLEQEVIDAIATSNLNHIASATFENNTLTLTRNNGGAITVAINSVDSPITIEGDNWDASTNTPDISGSTAGQAYVVAIAGTYEGINFAVKDWAVKTTTGWIKIDNQTIQAAWSNIINKPFDTFNPTFFEVVGGELTIKDAALLKGDDGDPGTPGASAYDLWLAEGNEGTIADFLNSISANAKLTETLIASGVSQTMGIPDGEEFLEDTLFTDVIRQLIRRAVHPEYELPTVDISVGYSSVEVGTVINPTLSAIFTMNDARNLINDEWVSAFSGYIYSKNGATIGTGEQEDSVVADTHVLNAVGSALYNVVATFTDYYTKKNNLEEYDATNKFADRSVEDSSVVYWRYKNFGLALNEEPAEITSTIIRSNNETDTWAGEDYSINLDGHKCVIILVPPGYELDTVNSKTNGDIPDPLFKSVTPTTWSAGFPCAGVATAVYKMYVKTNAVAYSGNTDLKFNAKFIKL